MDPDTPPSDQQPSAFNYVLSFILVGLAWGFTTPFIRRAAVEFNARQEEAKKQQQRTERTEWTESTSGERYHDDDDNNNSNNNNDDDNGRRSEDRAQAHAGRSTPQSQSWLRAKLTTLFWTVINLLRTPAYTIPLVLNLTGSVWFFLLVGKHELSLTVPITNSMAFLFTVLGEWYVDRKVIPRETWLGMGLVLGGIALCVESKG
ncbi:hypothetical protein VTN77DRAFT_9789 [Rasamsonia byssochlamydoides]|uniref:uncharacterized protein n=1 Tax=Rasamsonia byssochlamydoides TaxID=89139 RepID=UPI00374388D7